MARASKKKTAKKKTSSKSKSSKKSEEKKGSRKLVTGRFRLSFPKLFKPESVGDEEPKYGITMLFDPRKATDKKSLKALEDLALEAMRNNPFNWDKKTQDLIYKKRRDTLFLDGDEKEYDGYEGMIAVTAKNSRKPGVVDQSLDEITSKEDIYGGCYCRASVTAFAYNNKSKGVAFSLQNVQFMEDGEPFGNRSNPEDDFDEIEVEEEDEDEEDFD